MLNRPNEKDSIYNPSVEATLQRALEDVKLELRAARLVQEKTRDKLKTMQDDCEDDKANRMLLLKQGATLLKHQTSSVPHTRFVYLDEDEKYICWSKTAPSTVIKNHDPKGKFVAVSEITHVHLGCVTEAFGSKQDLPPPKSSTRDLYRRLAGSEQLEKLRCFSIVSSSRTLDVQCKDTHQRDVWAKTIYELSESLKARTSPANIGSGYKGETLPERAQDAGAGETRESRLLEKKTDS